MTEFVVLLVLYFALTEKLIISSLYVMMTYATLTLTPRALSLAAPPRPFASRCEGGAGAARLKSSHWESILQDVTSVLSSGLRFTFQAIKRDGG